MNNTPAAIAADFYRSAACLDALRAGKRVKVTASSGFLSVKDEGRGAWRVVRWTADRQPRSTAHTTTTYYTSQDAAIERARDLLLSYVVA